MKICVLEWICGGGLSSYPDLESELLAEGNEMLATLISGALQANCQVSIALDERVEWDDWRHHEALEVTYVPSRTETAACLRTWQNLASRADAAIVIAPELDSALQDAVQALSKGIKSQKAQTLILNMRGKSLALACDKWETFNCFQRLALPTPDTKLISSLTSSNMDEIESRNANSKWILKRRDGAGMEDSFIIPSADLRSRLANWALGQNHLAQPWIESDAFSCSAIVDSTKNWHWLPTVSQKIEIFQHSSAAQGLHYCGSELEVSTVFPVAWKQKLEQEFDDAVGWISFDFVRCRNTRKLYLIEVNPRCSTSMCLLAAQYKGNLVSELLGLSQCGVYSNEENWNIQSAEPWPDCTRA